MLAYLLTGTGIGLIVLAAVLVSVPLALALGGASLVGLGLLVNTGDETK